MRTSLLIFALLGVWALSSPACEVTTQQIQFPELGTHTAYYCKANPGELKKAIEAVKLEKCIAGKLREFKKGPVAVDANEVIPFGLTRAEAIRTGPIIDVRLVLDETGEHRAGYRALAQGKRTGTPQRMEFEVTDALYFERECPVTGCGDRVLTLCETAHFP